jgi:hypothetical protein
MKMVRQIPITMEEEQTVSMPDDAVVLDLIVQNLQVFLCVFEEANARMKARRVHVRSTGEECNGIEPSWHVGTVLIRQETLVFHIFVSPAKRKRPEHMPPRQDC